MPTPISHSTHPVHPVIAELRAHRVAAGLTVHHVAARAGVSREALSLIECGRHGGRLDTVAAYAGALGFELGLVKR